MIIKHDRDVTEFEVQDDAVRDVKGRILIGPDDGSDNIVMRLFRIEPGGHTPHHDHPHEHIVKVLRGKGRIVDGQGREHDVSAGMSALVPGGETHQFRNSDEEPFLFLCIILNPDKS